MRWLLSPFPWVVEYSLGERSLRFSRGILELSCPATFLFCTVSLETEHSLSLSLLHLSSWPIVEPAQHIILIVTARLVFKDSAV